MKAIGILGGTFDPVHHGHLRTALEIKNFFSLNEVRLLPSVNPPTIGKLSSIITPGKFRIQMLNAALEKQDNLVLDDREFTHKSLKDLQGPDFDKPVFTFDTLRTIRSENKFSSICFILGMDAFSTFHTWHKNNEILKIAHLIIIPRWGNDLSNSDDLIMLNWKKYLTEDINDIKNKTYGHIFKAPISRLDISSSQIRQQVKNGISPRYLLPKAVLDMVLNLKYYDRD
jgi:nicotinate-nucleotide adenylyltransferase|tara:strand:+ start:7624 stop:8307 length:684 start_codon:yes stop_codon:yes gene_type:complete